ncbi:MAG: hypothetical protein LBV45_03970 [Xanthomonadaceae bacterium]|jgi:transposase|nr:hypothetical protein [Xanthomonadaceae bacterium]
MEPIPASFRRIEDYLPRQRDRISLDDLQDFDAMLYVAENDCKWRSLPERRPLAQRLHTVQSLSQDQRAGSHIRAGGSRIIQTHPAAANDHHSLRPATSA